MKTIFRSTVGCIALSAFGCAHSAVINQTYTDTDPAFQRTYSKPTKECVDASAASLKDMKIGIEKRTNSELVTERYDAYHFATTTASVSGPRSVTANTQVNNQQAKMYLQILEQGVGCKVQIVRIRAWNNGEEFETLNVDFAKKMAVAPFFSEIDDRLKN